MYSFRRCGAPTVDLFFFKKKIKGGVLLKIGGVAYSS